MILPNSSIETFNHDDNWIYIGADVSKPSVSKIGKTTNKLRTRSTSSHNPNYLIYAAFQIKKGVDLGPIELSIINYLWTDYSRIQHFSTGEYSEWFHTTPAVMLDAVVNKIIDDYGNLVQWNSGLYGKEPQCYECDPVTKAAIDGKTPLMPIICHPIGRKFLTNNNTLFTNIHNDTHIYGAPTKVNLDNLGVECGSSGDLDLPF